MQVSIIDEEKTSKKKILSFPNFDDIPVSTKTITASTNLLLNIDLIFEFLPITEHIVLPKKRGRKRKNVIVEDVPELPYGSIVTLKYKGDIRGVELKPKKKNIKSGTKSINSFRNSFTVVINLDKIINFKMCRNGTFQMTGCKKQSQAQECIRILWEMIKYNKDLYSLKSGTTLQVLLIQCMRNIDFEVGFNVDREKLNEYMREKHIACLFETSFGYTGASIKIPLEEDISTMKIKKMEYINELCSKCLDIYNDESVNIINDINLRKKCNECKKWNITDTTYKEHLDTLTPKERKQKLEKERYVTFLVFHSGKVILSSLNSKYMKPYYYRFLSIIEDSYERIEEKLDS